MQVSVSSCAALQSNKLRVPPACEGVTLRLENLCWTCGAAQGDVHDMLFCCPFTWTLRFFLVFWAAWSPADFALRLLRLDFFLP